MYYLTKATYSWSNCEIYRVEINQITDYSNAHEFKLTVCDEFGKEVKDYKYEDIYGAYFENYDIILTVIKKEHLQLYKYLSFTSCDAADKKKPYVFNDFILFLAFGELRDDCHTVAGIILNTDKWSIDDDILTIYFDEYNFSAKGITAIPRHLRYKITDIQKFNNVLAKLKTLYRRK